jgi:hypothetical protein
MNLQNYTAAFQKEFPRGSSLEPRKGSPGIVVIVPCGDHKDTAEFEKRLPPEVLRRHMENRGWRFKGSRATCPACNKKDGEKMDDTKAAATQLARKARREAIQWLTEAFDADKGSYSTGVSDKTIAAETGLSEKAVADLREEFFGSIKEPAEFSVWRKEIASIRTDVGKMKDEAADACTNILTRLNALDKAITNVIERNGW